jgi:hypothetical protein
MQSPQEAREKKAELINKSHMMQDLLEMEGFTYLIARLEKLAEMAKKDAIASTSYEDLCYRRGIIEGLDALKREIDTIISRGKTQEHLTSK